MSNQSAHAEVLIVSVYVMALFEPSASDALPVTPTVASSAAFSATVLSAALESVGVDTSCSLISVIVMVIVSVSAVVPSVARITKSNEASAAVS